MKDTFQNLLSEMLMRFTGLAVENIDAEVALSLHVLNHWLETDRCTFYGFSPERGCFEVQCQTRDDELPPSPADTSQRIWFTKALAAGKVMAMSWLPQDLPVDASDERDYVQVAGMKSSLAVPISVGHRIAYAIAAHTFHEHRTWGEKTVDRIFLVGQVLANVMERKRAEQHLHTQIAELRALQDPAQESGRKRAEISNDYRSDIVGQSPAFVRTLEMVAQVAPTPSTVLLLGETGTGKELLAWAIHEGSPRRGKPFVRVNCAALPPSLIEDEFLGHEKGAFTGATATHMGRFELANGGTLFLDEIGDLPVELQPKLLRLLQDGEVQRIGSTRSRKMDVRIVAATNQDLHRAMAEGRFRRDLYYRLSVFPIEIPPLRERKEDIPLITWTFIERRQAALGRRIEEIPDDVMDSLVARDWPGNVRELENVLERAIILSPGKTLRLDGAVPAIPTSTTSVVETARDESFDAAAREHIRTVLERCNWRINGAGGAAEVLAVHPNTLRARLKKLGLERP